MDANRPSPRQIRKHLEEYRTEYQLDEKTAEAALKLFQEFANRPQVSFVSPCLKFQDSELQIHIILRNAILVASKSQYYTSINGTVMRGCKLAVT